MAWGPSHGSTDGEVPGCGPLAVAAVTLGACGDTACFDIEVSRWDKRATATGSGRLSSVGYSRLTVNVLRLALVLTLLGGPQALHMGPQDPNFTENLVDGNWFSIARASNEPKLLRTDSDTMFFIHKIHVTFKTTQFHVRRRVKGRCTPIVLTASKTRRKFQYVLKCKYGPAASSSPGVGSPGDSRAQNGQELAGQDAASQEGPTGCGTPWALSAAGGCQWP
ncbi:uncharacterized protein LOC128778600 [Panthera pardus]|uniref:Uncharacterized protein LOC128778600 n=1 Tax=Panthera pardus TaxID=9691 RepID=A0A9W2VZD5_PANPR|nr:uncharacterized protein LOC128778600 [Panthera pardus]